MSLDFSQLVQIRPIIRLCMFIGIAPTLLLASVAGVSGPSAATRHPVTVDRQCRVVASVKLPDGIDEKSICSAISDAMAAKAPTAHYRVEVHVRSEAKITAALVLDGNTLPAETMAVSDGVLGTKSIQRFADRLATVAAGK